MMDQAENLRNIIKKQNLKNITNSRVIAVTSGKGGVGKSKIGRASCRQRVFEGV